MDLDAITLPDGSTRKLGNRIPTGGFKYQWRVWGSKDDEEVIPRDKWDGLLAQYSPGLDDPHLPYVHDQDGVGQCFPPGTLIRMGDGSQKPIEDVKVLDRVLTAEGRVKCVTRTMVRHEATSLYLLKIWGHRHLKATAEHPILTKNGYVSIDELKGGDMVAFPRYTPNTKEEITTADYISRRVLSSRAKSERTIGIPGKPAAVLIRHKPPTTITLTPEFGRIVGLFLAEGWTDSGKVNWAFHTNEKDTLATELVGLIEKCLGTTANIRDRPHNCVVVTMYGTWWAHLFEALCATGSGSKRLHTDLTGGPVAFLTEVLNGWIDGDGLGDKQEGGVTISRTLATEMFDVANAIGYRPTIETLDVKINPKHKIKERQKRYIVKWTKKLDARGDDWRCELTDTHMYRRVEKVEREDYSGWVYNLEVEDDHSYVANSIGVHNCNADATVSALEATRMVQGLPFVKLSAADLYGRINGGGDNGSLLEDALHEMTTKGVGTAATSGLLWSRRTTYAPDTERAQFRVLEWVLCPTFDHCFSAVLKGRKLISGILWYDNYEPDSDGWLPLRPRGRSGGHAVFGYKPLKRKNVYGIAHQNSWSAKWGHNGRCVFPEGCYEGPVGGWWALRSVVDEGGVIPVP